MSPPPLPADPGFWVDVDPVHRLVGMRLVGLWTPDTFARFERHARDQLLNLPAYGCSIGDHVTLIDLLGFPVQQPLLVDLLAALASDRSVAPRRRAVLTHSALLRSQIRRIIPEFAFFTDRTEAIAWLMQREPTPVPA